VYLEAIQDLLVDTTDPNAHWEENLAVREDPQKGVFVFGLRE
jgi:hypothetical protein